MATHLSAYDTYVMYLGIKRHFNTESYDYIKYKGGVSCSPNSFQRRKDKYFFAKLAKKVYADEMRGFLICNLFHNPLYSIIDLADEECFSRFNSWIRRIKRLRGNIEDDVKLILDFLDEHSLSIEDLWDCSNGHPLIFKFYMQEMIYPETFLILDMIHHIMQKIDEHYSFDPVWSEHKMKLEKYGRFFLLNKYQDSVTGLIGEWQNSRGLPQYTNRKDLARGVIGKRKSR